MDGTGQDAVARERIDDVPHELMPAVRPAAQDRADARALVGLRGAYQPLIAETSSGKWRYSARRAAPSDP